MTEFSTINLALNTVENILFYNYIGPKIFGEDKATIQGLAIGAMIGSIFQLNFSFIEKKGNEIFGKNNWKMLKHGSTLLLPSIVSMMLKVPTTSSELFKNLGVGISMGLVQEIPAAISKAYAFQTTSLSEQEIQIHIEQFLNQINTDKNLRNEINSQVIRMNWGKFVDLNKRCQFSIIVWENTGRILYIENSDGQHVPSISLRFFGRIKQEDKEVLASFILIKRDNQYRLVRLYIGNSSITPKLFLDIYYSMPLALAIQSTPELKNRNIEDAILEVNEDGSSQTLRWSYIFDDASYHFPITLEPDGQGGTFFNIGLQNN
jgi:hypothetical protein